jgi:hypothetical protein
LPGNVAGGLSPGLAADLDQYKKERRHYSFHLLFLFENANREKRQHTIVLRIVQFSHPNIPKTNWLARIAMRLEFDRGSIELLVKRFADEECLAF